MSHKSHPFQFDHLSNIWKCVQMAKLPILKLPLTSSLIGPTVILCVLFSDFFSLRSSVNAKD
jgi:hypothetical protein